MQIKTIGSMATCPERLSTLEAVVDSIAPQLSRLYIYLNGYFEVPSFLGKYNTIVPVLGMESFGDISANGKMIWKVKERDGIIFTLDDDFIYPDNYVERFLEIMSNFNYSACLCVHGSLFTDAPRYYYERHAVYASKTHQKYNNIVNLVGSGTTVFPASLYDNIDFNFRGDVYVDLHISLTALKKEMPMLAVSRQQEWLIPIVNNGLWEKNKAAITHHTMIVGRNSDLLSWNHLLLIWDSFSRNRKLSKDELLHKLNISPESLDFLQKTSFQGTTLLYNFITSISQFSASLNKEQ